MSLLCCSCAITEHYEDDKLVSRTVGIGVMQEGSCDGDGGDGNNGGGSERTKTATFGISVGAREAVLGYRNTERICLPLESCGAVFLVDSAAEMAAIRRRFPDLAADCLIVEAPD